MTATMTAAFDDLANSRRWLIWRSEQRGGKPTKVPYACSGGGYAKVDDPGTWATRDEAETAARRLVNGAAGGIGLVLGDVGNDLFLAGLDLDDSLDDGLIADWAAAVLDTVRSYCEVSPSGRGLKVFFYIGNDDVRSFLDRIGVPSTGWGCRRGISANSSDHGPAIEFYCAVRYFAVTAQHWGRSPDRIALLDHVVLNDLAPLIPPAAGVSPDRNSVHGDSSRSAAAFRLAGQLIAGGCTYDEMVAALRAAPETAAWVREKGEAAGGRELKRLWQRAGAASAGESVGLADFYAYMPAHNYIYAPTREPWPGASVNARIPPVRIGTDEKGEPIALPAAAWLDRNQPVEQMTWAPGEPMVIENRLIADGGWIERPGVSVFNLYRPPVPAVPGDPGQAGRWLAHVRRVYPDDAAHIVNWLAHRVQHPDDKVNHALVLGGLQGIGKDSLLEPVKRAVGSWNFAEPSPVQLMGRFNGFARSVILRISEARDLGEIDRYQFYEHLKVYAAAPPDVLRIDEKNLREYNIRNCCGVVITTNHRTDGIYLPADDRRHYVAWSSLTKEDLDEAYWNELWRWYDSGGDRHVAAYLAGLDLSTFTPKAPPPKTSAFWDIVNASRAPEDAELADALDLVKPLGTDALPEAVTLSRVIAAADDEDFREWLKDRRNRRIIPHRFEACGYIPVRNPGAADGLWKIGSQRMVIYAKASLTPAEQLAAAKALVPSWRRSV
jgi:hypothetical protein